MGIMGIMADDPNPNPNPDPDPKPDPDPAKPKSPPAPKEKGADPALTAKLAAADQKISSLEASIAELKERAADGKPSPALEREVTTLKQQFAESENKRLQAEERANRKTIDADVRAMLADHVIDVDTAMKVLREDLRVDSDGKVAIRLEDGKEEWGSLSIDALLKRVPDSLKPARGVSGSGARAPKPDARADGTLVERAMRDQKVWNENEKEVLRQIKGVLPH
jgi:hypothetical protein